MVPARSLPHDEWLRSLHFPCLLELLAALGFGCSTSDDVAGAAGDASSEAPGADGSDDVASEAGRVPIYHRPSDAQCHEAPPAGVCTCGGNCTDPPFRCATDAECADAGPNGRCVSPGGPAGSGCTFDTCSGDADCASDQTCACHASPHVGVLGNRCVPGNRRADADCTTAQNTCVYAAGRCAWECRFYAPPM